MTNGEKLIEIFPNNSHISLKRTTQFVINPMTINQQMIVVDNDFWNAEYEESTTKNNLGVDCISRVDVLNNLANIAKVKAKSDAQKSLMGRCMFMVERMSSVTPQTRKGHWIPIYQGDEIIDYRCSECEFGNTFGKSTHGMNYCPNCGSDNSEV